MLAGFCVQSIVGLLLSIALASFLVQRYVLRQNPDGQFQLITTPDDDTHL